MGEGGGGCVDIETTEHSGVVLSNLEHIRSEELPVVSAYHDKFIDLAYI